MRSNDAQMKFWIGLFIVIWTIILFIVFSNLP